MVQPGRPDPGEAVFVPVTLVSEIQDAIPGKPADGAGITQIAKSDGINL